MSKELGKIVYDIVAAGDTEGFETLLKEYRLSLGRSGRHTAYFNIQISFVHEAIRRHNANILKSLPPKFEDFTERQTEAYWRNLVRFCADAYNDSDESKDVTKALLLFAAENDRHDAFLSQLLQQAVLKHNVEAVRYFLELVAERNCTGKNWVNLSTLRMELSDNLDNDKEITEALLVASSDKRDQEVSLSYLLQQAVLKHNVNAVKCFLELGVKHSMGKDWVDLSTLCMELSDNFDNDKEITEALLAASSDTGKQKVFLSCLLQQAVLKHNVNAAKCFLELGVKHSMGKEWVDLSSIRIVPSDTPDITNTIVATLLNTVQDTDKRNAFLLHLLRGAISDRCAWFVSSLLNFGVDLNCSDKVWEAISSACVDNCNVCSEKSMTTLQPLLNAITNTDKKNRLLLKLLEKAITRHDAWDVSYFLRLGADLSMANDDKIDMLSHWIGCDDYFFDLDQDREILEALLKAKADPNRQNILHNNTTALHAAAEKGSIGLMKLLVDHKADITKEDNDGLNPVVYGFYNGIDFTEKMYKEKLIDFSYHNSKGENYLMLFLEQEHSPEAACDFAIFATQNGLDIDDTTNDGKTVFNYLPRYDSGRLKSGYKSVEITLNEIKKEKKESEREDVLSDFSDIGF